MRSLSEYREEVAESRLSTKAPQHPKAREVGTRRVQGEAEWRAGGWGSSESGDSGGPMTVREPWNLRCTRRDVEAGGKWRTAKWWTPRTGIPVRSENCWGRHPRSELEALSIVGSEVLKTEAEGAAVVMKRPGLWSKAVKWGSSRRRKQQGAVRATGCFRSSFGR